MEDDLREKILPISDGDSRVKKKLLLQSISCGVCDACVSESILELLEMFEELDEREGIASLDSMIGAYCAVAVECTVKYLAANIHKYGKYFDAVERIWRGRVSELERLGKTKLVSDDLKGRMDEVEAAIWNENVGKKLTSENTRYEAFKSLQKFLGEARDALGLMVENRETVQTEDGPAETCNVASCVNGGLRLPMEAEVVKEKEEDLAKFEQKEGKDPVEQHVNRTELHESIEDRQTDKEVENESVEDRQNDTEVENGSVEDRQNVTEVENESVEDIPCHVDGPAEASNVASCVNGGLKLPTEVEVVEEKEEKELAKTAEQKEGKESTAQHAEWTEVNESVKDIQTDKEVEDAVSKNKGNLVTTAFPRRKHLAPARRMKGVKVTTSCEELEDNDALSSRYGSLLPREVNQVQEALKLSSLELRAVVKDPLPDVLHLSEALVSEMAVKGEEVDAASPCINQSTEPDQTEKTATENQQQKDVDVLRTSLMQCNSTATTLEWDSVDDLLAGNKLHLPSPSSKRKAVSPLRKYEPAKLTRRRKVKKWTVEEEDTLRKAVQKYGRGHWKIILEAYPEAFEERTEVDLKDKWRNLTRG